MSKRRSRNMETATPIMPGLLATPARRRTRALILPRELRKEAESKIHQGASQDLAHQILQHWADMEVSGHLQKKETSLDAEFLHDIFGRALGYKLSTETPESYHLIREYTIPGVGSADAAIGDFQGKATDHPIAIIELKSADVNIDRDRFNGRTPVQQCWDYLNGLPHCPWGIVSNFVTFRLYHRDKTPLAFEEFTLQELRDLTRFREFYCLLERGGLLRSTLGQPPRAFRLLQLTDDRQRTIGDQLYESYSHNRAELIFHLQQRQDYPLDTAIRVAQKILDRIIFIAFCEDRDLLPANVIDQAIKDVAPFQRVTNPKWQNFLNLFAAVDRGHESLDLNPGYNGGLFRHDPEVDDLQLDDKWTHFFGNVSRYDFKDEVNVDVLGHIFEKSITELEKLRVGGLFGTGGNGQPIMPKSAERKRLGIYYTPPDFTQFLVHSTLGTLVDERLAALADDAGIDLRNPRTNVDTELEYWIKALAALQEIKLCDPACGSGAFLIAAYDLLEERYTEVADHLELLGNTKGAENLRRDFPNFILRNNLYGVDLSQEAVEITQLALWIRTAQRGTTLADLSGNIVCGNSLVDEVNVHSRAMSWRETFPNVLDERNGGFDCVIGNPPWERVKLQEREFFSFSEPEIASAVSAANRRTLIAKLENDNPELFHRYKDAKAQAERMLTFARVSGEFPMTGKGDINYYILFAELARKIVRPNGIVGLLVPSGIASDKTTREFFSSLMDSKALIRLYDFENKKGIFQDLHRSFKFCVFVFGGSERQTDAADFVFFAHTMDDLLDRNRHVALSVADMTLVNPNTKTCPIFRSGRDAELTKQIYGRVPILIDGTRESGGNPWCVRFLRMFDQTNDAELFHSPEQLRKLRFKRRGNEWIKGKQRFAPLYEAKMVQMYDHRAAGVIVDRENWVRQGQTIATSLVEHQNPEFTVEPRWWIRDKDIGEVLPDGTYDVLLAYKDVTSPTNARTMIASFIPVCGAVNSAPIIFTGDNVSARLRCCLLANLNSFVYDFVARQKVGGIHLNFFIVEQLPTLAPDDYTAQCTWDKKRTRERWISDRVLKLACTADDMTPLAHAACLKRTVHKWRVDERAQLRAELDAAYFLLYGIGRDDVEYIMSTFTGTRRRDESETGSFRTAELILEAYDRFKATS